MLSFKQFLIENDNNIVHRIDNEKINDFDSNLNTYHHNSDWTQSKLASPTEKPKKGFKSSKGLFAGDLHSIAPYASPKGTKFIQHYDESGQSHLYFDKKDEEKINNHKPTLSSFSKKNFNFLKNSGEHFSKKPGKPIKQTTINNPTEFMRSNGHIVHFVDDLNRHKQNLEKNNIQYNSEGFN